MKETETTEFGASTSLETVHNGKLVSSHNSTLGIFNKCVTRMIINDFYTTDKQRQRRKNSYEDGPVNQVYNEPNNFKKSATEIMF